MFQRVDLNVKLQCCGVYFYLENCIQDDLFLFMDHKREMKRDVHISVFEDDPVKKLIEISLDAKNQMCDDLRVYLNLKTLDKFTELLQPYLLNYLRFKV